MYLKDTAAYLDIEKRDRILKELFFNAFHTIKNVYLFKHFDDYVFQLQSSSNEDKKEVYWNVSYYEKLIDHIRISVAFETYNKAMLLKNGFLVHKIKSSQMTKAFYNIQSAGIPVEFQTFLNHCGTTKGKDRHENIYLNGLTDYFQTINYSTTLSEPYQAIIGLDKDFVFQLAKINDYRNRLHFFTEATGAFEVTRHIAKWKSIMEKSITTIEAQLKAQ